MRIIDENNRFVLPSVCFVFLVVLFAFTSDAEAQYEGIMGTLNDIRELEESHYKLTVTTDKGVDDYKMDPLTLIQTTVPAGEVSIGSRISVPKLPVGSQLEELEEGDTRRNLGPALQPPPTPSSGPRRPPTAPVPDFAKKPHLPKPPEIPKPPKGPSETTNPSKDKAPAPPSPNADGAPPPDAAGMPPGEAPSGEGDEDGQRHQDRSKERLQKFIDGETDKVQEKPDILAPHAPLKGATPSVWEMAGKEVIGFHQTGPAIVFHLRDTEGQVQTATVEADNPVRMYLSPWELAVDMKLRLELARGSEDNTLTSVTVLPE
ncbi:MAG: hypothetical protein Q8R76_01435 [Candidatus Omnitrophota bacterium]|nr:hypothetical protein [Candidatus Omnitrophota bacterium]